VLCAPGNVSEFVKGVTALVRHPEMARALGRNARRAASAHYSWSRHVANLWTFLSSDRSASDLSPDLCRKPRMRTALAAAGRAVATATAQEYNGPIAPPSNDQPAGSRYVAEAAAHPKEWFLEAERCRYTETAPWMPELMEFDRHGGEDVLEIGGGMGTDLAQYAARGARVTDVDLSGADLTLAKENFVVRGLKGRFIQHDAETLVFDDNSFDLVYANGVLPHTINTTRMVREIFRVLRPGGLVIASVYAEDSLYYWRNLVWNIGLREGQLRRYSTGALMSRMVERSCPVVKAYTRKRLAALFDPFSTISISQQHIEPRTVPRMLRRFPPRALGRIMGWSLIIKATKPR
jgi:ubiquinone/menaquinone biosynthesis C-methylase UbiE